MATAMNKSKVLSIEEKVKILWQAEKGKKKAEVHKEFYLINSAI